MKTKTELNQIAAGIESVTPQSFYFRGDEAKYLGTTSLAFGAVWFDAIYLEGHRKGVKFVTSVPPAGTTVQGFREIYAAHGIASVPAHIASQFGSPVSA